MRLVANRLGHKELRRDAAEFLPGLADRGQRYRGGRGQLDVVVTGDGNVARHPDPVPRHLLHDPERDQVVGAKHRSRPLCGRQAGDARTGGLPGRQSQRLRLDHLQVARAATGPVQRTDRAVAAVGHLPGAHRAAHIGDPLMTRGYQVRQRQVTAKHVIDRNRALTARRRRAADKHDRRATALQPGDALIGTGDGRDQDPLNTVFLQQFEVARLLLPLVVTVAQDDGETRFACLILDAAGYVGEEGVRHVKHDEADHPAAART